MPRRACLILVLLSLRCYAHDTPVQLPPPQSPPEAWNVIEQSKANINQLLDANLTHDIGAQLANIAIALRALGPAAVADEKQKQIADLSSKLVSSEVELLRDSRDANDARKLTTPAWTNWCGTLAQLESLYPRATLNAQVYICPMHPFDRHLNPADKCSVCGMSLVRRHLPASVVYQKPGQQTLLLSATAAPLVVGQMATVTIHLANPNGSPVRLDDLIEMHTKKIHLLINDQSLDDYHHEHPQPTNLPGDYAFTFTPKRPGPYRIWADVVPADSGIQEYDITDLPANTAPQPIADRDTRLSSVVDGRRFDLNFNTAGNPIRAGQTIIGTITVTEADGKPCTSLQPVMGAFAHLVGFSEDHTSVLHIHPYSKEPSGPDDHAGPAFAFKFYTPAPGFLRLYCQVRLKNQDVFAPFNLTILPVTGADRSVLQPPSKSHSPTTAN